MPACMQILRLNILQARRVLLSCISNYYLTQQAAWLAGASYSPACMHARAFYTLHGQCRHSRKRLLHSRITIRKNTRLRPDSSTSLSHNYTSQMAVSWGEYAGKGVTKLALLTVD